MKKILRIFLFFAISNTAISQTNSYDRYWHFAPTTGFDWISGSPVIVGTSSANQTEGCVTQNDVNGNLLFYGGDDKIYDSTHAIMQNGSGIISTTPKQGPISIQDPGNIKEYYYIYPSANGGPLRYSKIDMSANSNLGTVKNKMIVNYEILKIKEEKIGDRIRVPVGLACFPPHQKKVKVKSQK